MLHLNMVLREYEEGGDESGIEERRLKRGLR